MEEQQDVLRSRACEVHLGQDAKSLLTVDWVPDKETNLVNSLPVVGEEGCVGLIHVWAPPADWDEHFPHLPYAEAKQREMQRAFGDKECMVTCDVTCLSAPLSEADHPLEQVHWGPILFTTKEVKARIRSPYDTTDSSVQERRATMPQRYHAGVSMFPGFVVKRLSRIGIAIQCGHK